MPNEPGRHVALRRSRSTSDIVRGAVLIDLPERATYRRDRRVFSVDDSMSLTIVPPTDTTHSPLMRNEQPSAATPPANDPPVAPFSPLTQNPSVQGTQGQGHPTSSRIAAFFGLGRNASRQRKLQMGLIQALTWNLIQAIVITVILILTATHFRSTINPRLSEWTACDRPLGIWSCLWLLRVCLSTALKIWDYRRHPSRRPNDEETRIETPGRTAGSQSRSQSASASRQLQSPTNSTSLMLQGSNVQATNENQEQTTSPNNHLFSRLTLLSSLLTLSWFLTAHILEYTSVKTCRRTSPHLWWLLFGILSIMYLMILEVLILGIFVFVIGPIIYLIWSLILIALGRHPLQNPTAINPEIGKLPRSVVDRIPLVMYIPPPPDGFDSTESIKPDAVYSYPPKQRPTSKSASGPRFKFLRHISFKGNKNTVATLTDERPESEPSKGSHNWENKWEQGGLPFVILEDNRAACAICLNDFEVPRRKAETSDEVLDNKPPASNLLPNSETLNVITEEERNGPLRLEDAGEGAQPLRLLQCGHVFHKTCLDPWLTDVSGRCPICQRTVEVPSVEKKKKRRHRRQNTT
ncbi:hypothetical protein AX15_005379 [Amanita polypyramis BW_CC]|nr:hypothetical protein AX15_005379 [Amanita polypyramis BW_CC]